MAMRSSVVDEGPIEICTLAGVVACSETCESSRDVLTLAPVSTKCTFTPTEILAAIAGEATSHSRLVPNSVSQKPGTGREIDNGLVTASMYS